MGVQLQHMHWRPIDRRQIAARLRGAATATADTSLQRLLTTGGEMLSDLDHEATDALERLHEVQQRLLEADVPPGLSVVEQVEHLLDMYDERGRKVALYLRDMGVLISALTAVHTAFDPNGPAHARHNLEGALIDLENAGSGIRDANDPVSIATINRVIGQLYKIEQALCGSTDETF